MNSSEPPSDVSLKLNEVKFRAELSALYHQKRERFFELFDKLSKVANLFAGSAALWKAADSKSLSAVAIVMSVSSALALVFSWSERARRHSELARSYRDVLTKIALEGEESLELKTINSWASELCAIEAKEPPSLAALVVACHNELAIARNQDSEYHPQSLLVRCSMHYFDLPHAPKKLNVVSSSDAQSYTGGALKFSLGLVVGIASCAIAYGMSDGILP
ncbi:hypothetical protein GTP41_19305 [Pseudoduganella sp. DS3]|uniref:SMODS and SLOG-associating 2TM effector domain-containing protein n=1 Tax=Pseudoduganella guangdongensis TaxID=2692179 RepID=A0A6N9HM12_9BURK|nr:hypothetical protein [Pseudoduganella guangdongensis]MYN04243.1 hypothetical protein [Pseudoduganella guangdongensis]